MNKYRMNKYNVFYSYNVGFGEVDGVIKIDLRETIDVLSEYVICCLEQNIVKRLKEDLGTNYLGRANKNSDVTVMVTDIRLVG